MSETNTVPDTTTEPEVVEPIPKEEEETQAPAEEAPKETQAPKEEETQASAEEEPKETQAPVEEPPKEEEPQAPAEEEPKEEEAPKEEETQAPAEEAPEETQAPAEEEPPKEEEGGNNTLPPPNTPPPPEYDNNVSQNPPPFDYCPPPPAFDCPPPPPSEIYVYDWVKHLTGHEEKDLRNPDILKTVIEHKDIYKEDEAKYGGYHLTLKNSERNVEYDAGHFYTQSVGSLQDEYDALNTAEGASEFQSCELIVDLRQDAAATKYVDVAYIQASGFYPNAMFQAASNFNGIEAIEEGSSPEAPKFLTEYVDDMTQGPSASVSAGPGAVTRLFCPFYQPERPAEEWSQTKDRQVEFLEDVKKYFTVENGYVVQSGNEDSLEVDPDGEEVEKKEEVEEKIEEKIVEEVSEDKKEEVSEESFEEAKKEAEEEAKAEVIEKKEEEEEEKKDNEEEVKEDIVSESEEKKQKVEEKEEEEKEEEEEEEEERKEEEEEEEENGISEEEKERIYTKIMRRVKVGVHANIQPTFGEKNLWDQTMRINYNQEARISQVFCAAMNLRQGENGYNNYTIESGTRKAELLLEAAYRGTYLAAIRHKCPTLLLTLIGGGAFGNSTNLIFDVIKRVHLELACVKKNQTLRQVRVVLFSMANGMIDFLKDLQNRGVDVKIYAYRGDSGTIYTKF